jgi:hypothetical protein
VLQIALLRHYLIFHSFLCIDEQLEVTWREAWGVNCIGSSGHLFFGKMLSDFAPGMAREAVYMQNQLLQA